VLASVPSKQDLVREFITEHVLNHAANGYTWNLPFLHVAGLDWLHYDWVMLGLAVILAVLLGTLAARRHRPVPTGIANVFEAFVVFIRDDISVAHLGPEEGPRMVSFFCSLFLFILALNVLGLLIPLCAVATGSVSVTCALSLVFLVLAVGLSIRRRGLRGFLRAFVPHGAPALLLPVLVPIEVISLVARTFALMIRLFANMLAGHIVIFAMVGLMVIFGLWALPVMALVVALFFFEIFVAVFQAYIFTLLSAIFMGLLLNPEH
jgi:F-type H+-transporting ATPase subunit a